MSEEHWFIEFLQIAASLMVSAGILAALWMVVDWMRMK